MVSSGLENGYCCVKVLVLARSAAVSGSEVQLWLRITDAAWNDRRDEYAALYGTSWSSNWYRLNCAKTLLSMPVGLDQSGSMAEELLESVDNKSPKILVTSSK